MRERVTMAGMGCGYGRPLIFLLEAGFIVGPFGLIQLCSESNMICTKKIKLFHLYKGPRKVYSCTMRRAERRDGACLILCHGVRREPMEHGKIGSCLREQCWVLSSTWDTEKCQALV